MFGNWLPARVERNNLDAFYFERLPPQRALSEALDSGRHVLLHGQARQGKTTLLRRVLQQRDNTVFFATPKSKFADISRMLLMTLGASVTVERKRRRTKGAKAEISWKWPIFSAGGEVHADTETELTQRTITADISNPNDICYLLREFGREPCLVIEHFELLRRRQRRRLLEFMHISDEAKVLQVVLVASCMDAPLDWREKVELAGCLTSVELPPLSQAECDACVDACLGLLGRSPSRVITELLYETFEGSVEPTIRSCAIAAPHLGANVDADTLRATVLAEIQAHTQTQCMALLSRIIESEWSIPCGRRVAVAGDGASWSPKGDLPIADQLVGDPVFRALQEHLADLAEDRPQMDEALSGIFDQATTLGELILTTPTDAESVRLLAFAISVLAENPAEPVDDRYTPARENMQHVNLGVVLCELLMKADADHRLVVNTELLEEHLGAAGLEIEEDFEFDDVARRLRRLQRRLSLNPPIFGVSEDTSQIILWQPKHAQIFGDIRPQLKAMLDALESESETENAELF